MTIDEINEGLRTGKLQIVGDGEMIRQYKQSQKLAEIHARATTVETVLGTATIFDRRFLPGFLPPMQAFIAEVYFDFMGRRCDLNVAGNSEQETRRLIQSEAEKLVATARLKSWLLQISQC